MPEIKQSRMTQQRRVILEEVRKLKSHPTASQVYDTVRKRLPKVSLGTVYRNLDLLSESGEVWRLATSGTQYRFDGNTAIHHHIVCVVCGRVDDVEGPTVEIGGASAAETLGYEILDHRFEFLGKCPGCRDEPGDKA